MGKQTYTNYFYFKVIQKNHSALISSSMIVWNRFQYGALEYESAEPFGTYNLHAILVPRSMYTTFEEWFVIGRGTSIWQWTSDNPVQPEKTEFPIDVTEDGMVIDVKEEQPKKAPSPKDVTDGGIIIEGKAVHVRKANSPIDVTEDGMISDVKSVQS